MALPDIDELQARVEGLAMEMFKWKLDRPVVISSRMKRTLGQYVWEIDQRTGRPELVKFKFAAKLFTSGYSQEDIDWIIKHELIHWYTDITEGRPCHHNSIWKANCRKFGIPDSRMVDLRAEREDYRWKYECTNPACKMVFRRYRKVPKNYVCGKCRGRLKGYPIIQD